MKLTDLHPQWVYSGGEGISDKDGNPVPFREKVGISFDCPCGKCPEGFSNSVYLSFENPPDGGPPVGNSPHWHRQGEDFETISLSPSILRIGGCGWHGYVTNGEIVNA